MKTSEIQAGNQLIYEFLGKPSLGFIPTRLKDFEYTDYHQSWDMLMPVVEKIASRDWSGVTIKWGTGCTDSFAHCDIDYNVGKRSFKTSEDLNSDEQSLITAVYLAVVEFIKWFNQK